MLRQKKQTLLGAFFAVSYFLLPWVAGAADQVSEQSYCESVNYSDFFVCSKYKNREFYTSDEFVKYRQQQSCQGATGEDPKTMAADCNTSPEELKQLYGVMYDNTKGT